MSEENFELYLYRFGAMPSDERTVNSEMFVKLGSMKLKLRILINEEARWAYLMENN